MGIPTGNEVVYVLLVLQWMLPIWAKSFFVPQLNLIWTQSKTKHKKAHRAYRDFFQTNLEVVGARDVGWARCGRAVLQ